MPDDAPVMRAVPVEETGFFFMGGNFRVYWASGGKNRGGV
jgi:hypothetical protein